MFLCCSETGQYDGIVLWVLLLIVSFKNRTNGDVISRKREMEALKACCKDEMSDPLAE